MSSNSNLYNKIVIKTINKDSFLTQKMYKGFSTVNTNTENFKLYDFELIQQDLLNQFYVRQGERLMNPQWGTVIWDMIFEPLTDEVKSIITQNVDQILNSDPRIVAEQIVITPYESGIQIECTISYLPYNISQKMQLKFDQNNGLLAT